MKFGKVKELGYLVNVEGKVNKWDFSYKIKLKEM